MTDGSARAGKSRYSNFWPGIIFVLAFATIMRLRSFPPTVIDWDESLYAVVARELMEGRLPYVSAFEIKPLGVFIAMAGFMATFGKTVFAIRLLGLICVCATCLLLYAIARCGGLSRLAALASAMFYAGVTTTMGGLATNIEILYAPFVVAAALVALRTAGQRDPIRQIGATLGIGFLIGLAAWFKYLAVLPGSALILMLLIAWWARGARVIHIGFLGAVFWISAATPTIISGGYYAWLGHWSAFWHANFGFMSSYAALGGGDFRESIVRAGMTVLPVALIATFGIPSWRARRFWVGALFFWLIAEGAAVSVPGKFYDHYFILILPPVCLFGALGVDAVSRRVGGLKVSWLPATLLVFACVPYVLYGVARWVWPLPDAPREIAEVIRSDQRPGDTLWVVNSEPVIYLLTGLPIPTVYVMPPHLLSAFSAIIPGNADSEISRLIATRPRYVVIDPEKWSSAVPQRRARIEAMLASEYRQIASFPFWYGPVLLYKSTD